MRVMLQPRRCLGFKSALPLQWYAKACGGFIRSCCGGRVPQHTLAVTRKHAKHLSLASAYSSSICVTSSPAPCTLFTAPMPCPHPLRNHSQHTVATQPAHSAASPSPNVFPRFGRVAAEVHLRGVTAKEEMRKIKKDARQCCCAPCLVGKFKGSRPAAMMEGAR